MSKFNAITESDIMRAGVTDSKGRMVAEVYGDSAQERSERSVLFAEAPDLLAALKRCLAYMDGFTQHDAGKPSARQQANAAIARIEGSAQ